MGQQARQQRKRLLRYHLLSEQFVDGILWLSLDCFVYDFI